MKDYKNGSHTVWDCKYHLVWITKYRYPVLVGDVGLRAAASRLSRLWARSFPFLDHRVIKFASYLHPWLETRGLNEKYLLKRVLARHPPPATVARYKQPYRAPGIAAFFGAGGPPDYVKERLGTAALEASGYFDPQRVQFLLRKIEQDRVIGFTNNMALLGILSTQLWHQAFVDGRDLPENNVQQ